MHAAKRLIFDIHFKYRWHFRSPTLHQAGHPVVAPRLCIAIRALLCRTPRLRGPLTTI